jgi:putative transcriptional regulator
MSRLLNNIHKSAQNLHAADFIDGVTMREFDALCLPPLKDYTPDDIRKIRQDSKVSQAVFAKFLNVKTITVAAWEQGTKKPGSTAVKILDIVERKGLNVLQ